MTNREAARRLARVTPGGAQTRSKRSETFPWAPIVLLDGSGAQVWDVEGRRYIDWICGLASIGLGYRYPVVDDAVLGETGNLSLPSRKELVFAEQLCHRGEQVRFVKTGSEATEGAMRIARCATGRSTIISIGYHGWHSLHALAADEHPGVPRWVEEYEDEPAIVGCAWGDAIALRSVLQWARPAAILLEPLRDAEPPPGYFETVRELCTAHNALLIADEIVTGYRWALRGAQELYPEMKPDLSCFGKAAANGYPLAWIVGSRELMKYAEWVSGTFNGETVALAAAMATRRVYQQEPVLEHMKNIGESLIEAFNDLASMYRSQLRLVGFPQHPRLVTLKGSEKQVSRFLRDLAQAGVLWHPAGFNVSYSHSWELLNDTIAACRSAFRKAQR